MHKVFSLKLKLVLDEFYESHPYKAGKIHTNCENDPYDDMKERLLQLAEKFERYLSLLVFILLINKDNMKKNQL